jgi:CelD/BcsL family acetyltransferase involved in cellulose biosynthesis
MPEKSNFEVKVLRSFEELERVRANWTSMQRHPESDYDFFVFIGKIRPEIIRPHVVVVYQDGVPVSLLAARLEQGQLEFKLGYKVLWRAKVRRIVIFYDGFMGDTGPEITKLVIRQLLKSLREEKADLFLWNGVQPGTDLQLAFRQLPTVLCRDHLMRTVEHWKMSLPATLDEMLEQRMDKKQRYNAKRSMKLIEKDFPGEVRYARYTALEDVETLFRDVIKVAKKTYQWGLGVGFLDTREQLERLQLEAKHGWLRGYVLYVKNEPVGFWLCTVYGDTVHSNYTGYDPQYRKQEVGTAIFLHMIGELCREKSRGFDFGLGAAFYKSQFGDAKFMEANVCIFAASVRGVILNGLRLLTEGGVDLARKVLSRSKLDQKIKKAWRRRAAAAATE